MKSRAMVYLAAVAGMATAVYVFNDNPSSSRNAPKSVQRPANVESSNGSGKASTAMAARSEENASAWHGAPVKPLANQAQTPDGSIFAKISENHAVQLRSEEAVRHFLVSQSGGSLAMGKDDGLTLKATSQDEKGNIYYKYAQTYQGLPVFGRELIVQVGASGNAMLVAGSYEPNISLPATPKLEADRAVLGALNKAVNDVPVGQPSFIETPSLVVYTDGNTPPVLAFRAVVEYTSSSSGQHKDQVFVDANTGSMVAEIPMIHAAFSDQIYTLNQKCISGTSDLPGTSVAASADTHTQGADKNAAAAYWFYKNFLGRDSLDNQGMVMKASVHAKFQGSSSCDGQNAFFDTTTWGAIFGEGGTDMNTPPAAPDVVAHELTHGVTGKTSNLTYKDESGALNEGMSDIFGSAAEAWTANGGSSSGNPGSGIVPNANTWIMGDTLASSGNVKFKRFMNNPTQDGHSKDNYPERYTGTSDNGGVHSNSGILNLAFYLLSQGGAHPRSSISTVDVPGIGIEKALKIYYLANTSLFTSSTNFSSARNLIAQAASNLYGNCSQEYKSVQLSFDAVKVPGTWTCDSTSGGTVSGSTATTANLLSGSSVTASSYYSSSYVPSNMVDGSMTTSWATWPISYYQEWFQIDMKSSKFVGSVTINWAGNNIPRHFTVGAWINNMWTPIKDVWNSTAVSSQTITLGVSARYLMVTMDSGSFSTYYYGVSEITAQ